MTMTGWRDYLISSKASSSSSLGGGVQRIYDTDRRSRSLETASFPELGFKLRDQVGMLAGPPS